MMRIHYERQGADSGVIFFACGAVVLVQGFGPSTPFARVVGELVKGLPEGGRAGVANRKWRQEPIRAPEDGTLNCQLRCLRDSRGAAVGLRHRAQQRAGDGALHPGSHSTLTPRPPTTSRVPRSQREREDFLLGLSSRGTTATRRCPTHGYLPSPLCGGGRKAAGTDSRLM